MEAAAGSARGGSPAGRRDPDLASGRARVGLLGLFGIDNFGNEASLDVMVRLLRSHLPGAHLVCVCRHPEKVRADHGIEALPILPAAAAHTSEQRRLWRRVVRTLFLRLPREAAAFLRILRCARALDAIIVPGTGILDDFSERPSGLPYSLFQWCVAARVARVPVLFVSIGAGPIHHPVSRWLMKTAAGLATCRSYRDVISKDFMTGLGLDTRRDPVVPDLVFHRAQVAGPQAVEGGRRLRVAVGVMAYHGWHGAGRSPGEIYATYVGKMAAFVSWLADSGHEVRLVIGDLTDQGAADDLRRMVATQRPELGAGVLVSEPIRSFEDALAQLRQTDVAVVTRFHSVIGALMLGTPVLSIGYAKKNDVLMTEMGLDRFCQHIETLDVERLKAQFTLLARDRVALARVVASVTAEYRERLDVQFASLFGGDATAPGTWCDRARGLRAVGDDGAVPVDSASGGRSGR